MADLTYQAVHWGPGIAALLADVLDDECRQLAEAGKAVPVVVMQQGAPVGGMLLHYDGDIVTALAVAGRGAEGDRLLPDLMAYVRQVGQQVGAARIGCRTRRPGLVRQLLRADAAWSADVWRPI